MPGATQEQRRRFNVAWKVSEEATSQTPASGRRQSYSYTEATSTVPKVFLSHARTIEACQIANQSVQCFQTLLMNEILLKPSQFLNMFLKHIYLFSISIDLFLKETVPTINGKKNHRKWCHRVLTGYTCHADAYSLKPAFSLWEGETSKRGRG